MQGLDTPELQLRSTAIISLLCSDAILSCMHVYRSVCGMIELLCPSVVALLALNLISCTNNKVLITLGGRFYGSFTA